MPENRICPSCSSENLFYSKKRDLYICEDCNYEFGEEKITPSRLRIFLSYGHDQNEELVKLIKAGLEKRGHDVWFDKSGIKEHGIKPGDDWRRAITDGIISSNRVVSFLSKHSTREPGVCLDEISIAIGVKGGNIQTILVESETEVKAPPSLSHIQWLDMHNWKEKQAEGIEIWEKWYNEKFNEIVDVIESEESRRFAGEIETLAGYLKPIASDSRISQLLKKGFVGREWVTDSVEQWRTAGDHSSRLFWILGNPGVGKSAIMAHLSHFGKDRVIAAQFCEYDKPDHRNAARVICSLAFQLATRLPDYRKLLLALPEINKLETKGESELFDYLFATPLRLVIEGGRERYLILIDALDEAKEGERNPLVEMLALQAPRLPEWLGIVVSSRPEKNVTDPLQGLNPFILDTDSETNKEDIRHYLELELKTHLDNLPDAGNIVEQILRKSEGVFLYAERVCKEIQEGNLSLDRLGEFPRGLGGIYMQFFQRQFPDPENFRKDIRPALRAILAAPEPLPVHLLGKLFNWKREELNDFTRLLGSLFPVLEESGQKVIKHYHKTIIDWIREEKSAGAYLIDIEEGNKLLSDFGWQQFIQGHESMDLYFVKWLPRHLLKLEKWDDLVELLCNLDYIQNKAAVKLTYHLVEDFNLTLKYIPDNAENIRKENERQARMDKYTRDLIAYSKGEISELEIPETIIPWSKEKINTEIERMKSNPTRLDRLKDFLNFLGQEAGNLQNYAHEFPHFTTQQAWNYADDSGTVGKIAGKAGTGVKSRLFLRNEFNRFPWNPIPQVRKALYGHKSSIENVCISPDGKRALSGSRDKTVILWDLESGQIIKTLTAHTKIVNAVAITPDGNSAVSGSNDNSLIIWDLKAGQKVKTLSGYYILSVSITPDGTKVISGSEDGTILFREIKSGHTIYVLHGHNFNVNAITILPKGDKALSGGGDNTLILWDLKTGQKIKELYGHSDQVLTVSVTPDCKRAVSGAEDGKVILWDLMSMQKIKTLNGHTDFVNSVCITPDGKYAVSGSSDSTLIVWNLNTGEKTKTLIGHSDRVFSVSITPDGQTAVSGSEDDSLIIWNLASGEPIKSVTLHKSRVNAVSVTSNDNKAVSGSEDNSIILWNLKDFQVIKTLKGHHDAVSSVNITPDGKFAVSGSYDKTIILWDLESGQKIKIFIGHSKWVEALGTVPNGRFVISGSKDNSIILWDLNSGGQIRKFNGHSGAVATISITPDGKCFLSGSFDKSIILWDIKSGQIMKIFKGHTDAVVSSCITLDGKYAITGSYDKNIIIWDLKSGLKIKTLTGHTYDVNSICTTQNNKFILSGSEDKTIILWNLQTFQKTALFVAQYYIYAIANYPSGIFLGDESGQTYTLSYKLDPLSNGISSIRSIWDLKLQQYLPLSADCPLCGHRFAPPASILAEIDMITKKAGLKSEQSPCLELPEDVWEEPGLLSNCPNCQCELKFNPFIAGGEI